MHYIGQWLEVHLLLTIMEGFWSGYSEVGSDIILLPQAEDFAMNVWHRLTKWKVTHFQSLPQWLQDNDFLHFGHRPPLPTSECFKSIVRIHTETGNIWTHLLGTELES